MYCNKSIINRRDCKCILAERKSNYIHTTVVLKYTEMIGIVINGSHYKCVDIRSFYGFVNVHPYMDGH